MQSNPPEAATFNPNLTEGQQVGGCFVLKRELFQSRGSRVWLAQDEVLGKEVTLHFIPQPVVGDARALAELRQEVKRNRQLIHPNILRVYDLVEDSGMIAVAMDGFVGESLADLLRKKGAFEPEDIRVWIQLIAETLGDAHRIQLFHRDLSPENIFIRSSGGALLANFGVSRVVAEAMERAGHLKGEAAHLAYLSPQQIDGERPAASDDVYGLGVLAYELLTGTLPFTGENIVQAIRKTAPTGVNAIRGAAGRSSIPSGWERFIEGCLAKSADARPKTCGEALAALDSTKNVEPARVAEIPVPKPKLEAETKAPVAPSVLPEPAKTTISVGASKAAASTSAAAPSQLPPTPPSTPKSKPVPALSANYPDLDRPKSKLPLIGLGVAASVLAAAIYFKNETSSNTGVGSAVSRVEDTNFNPGPETSPGEQPLAAGAKSTDPDSTAGAGAIADAGNEIVSPVPEIVPTDGADATQVAAAADGGSKKSEGRGLIGANGGKDKPAAGTSRNSSAKGATAAPAPAPAPAPKEPEPAAEAAPAPSADTAKKPGAIPVIPVPQAPQPLPKLAVPANADPDQLAKLLEERKAAISKFTEAAAAAEKVHTANAQLRDIRAEDLDGQKKALEEKRKTLTPALKAAAEFDAEKKRLEESMAKTEAAAKEAARAAEVAKKSYEELLSNSGDKMAAKQKAETELSSVTQAVTEGTKQVDELSQAASKAEAQRQQMLDARKQAEQEIKTLTTALDKATKAQREAMVKANRPKINALEQQIKEVDEQLERYQKAVASLQALNDESTKDATQRIQEKINAANAQKAGFQEEIKRLSGLAPAPAAPAPQAKPESSGASAKPVEPAPAPDVETSAPGPAASKAAAIPAPAPAAPSPAPEATPAPAAVAPAAIIAKADPVKTAPPAPAPAENAKGAGNSLGMKFVTVGDVDFSVYLVTRKDFEVFSKATNLKPEHWRNPGFEQSPEHPVVNVTWKEADAFCKWLTDKERKSGNLKPTEFYRLPTDTEWSKAVGLPAESGATPEERDMRVEDVYPWGTQWPPPAGAGNFAGEETVTELPIEGYNDKFPNTSPVGSFRANASGLYDMGGNVWQWVQDSFDGSTPAKTLRGGSWYNGAIKMSLLSSCRIKSSPETINDTYGFRIVKATDGKGKK